MRGVVYRGPRSIEIADDLPVPVLMSPRDAVVRITSAAVCGTDLHPYRGELPSFQAGSVLGHEFAGVIAEAGSETSFKPGEQVFASDIIACGRCPSCARGWHYQCEHVSLFGYSTVVGRSYAGGQAEYVRVPYADTVLARTPWDVADQEALFVGDVLSTAYAVVMDARVTPGSIVAVVGAGPVGLLAAACASVAGASKVIMSEPNPMRRERADALGHQAVPPTDFCELVADLTRGRGASAVIEAVGQDAALRSALEVAAARATVAVCGAHHSSAMPFPTGLAFAKELTVRFTVGDPIRLRDQVLPLIQSGQVDPMVVVSHQLPLSEARTAYELLDRQEALKVLLLPDDEASSR